MRIAGTLLLFFAALASGCAAREGRFKDQPVVWRVEDTRDIAEPEEREFLVLPYATDVIVTGRVTHVLSLPNLEPAEDTNALDEVPDSSWFTNRIGVRQVTPQEAARGVSDTGPPQLPIKVIGGKVGGTNPGFLVEDARKKKFLVKFDPRANPELQTSASVIVNRIFWTLGYFVPNDDVFVFGRGDLSMDPKAKVGDDLGNKRTMTIADVEKMLADVPRLDDGRYRASSSELLEGKPKGGFSAKGLRQDDANDAVPHQHRREVRAVRVFGAWVNHSDMKEDNTLDMYVTEGGRRFLRHYFIDFGEALGGHAAEKGRFEDGFEHYWDWERQSRAFVSFGLWKRPWEDVVDTPWPSIGPFVAEPFDPLYWREAYPYWPYFEMDAADAYWGAKLVMRFDRPLLEAIVKKGQLSDPEAAAYLVDTLMARRKKIGQAYLEALTALDDFTLEPNWLCAVDLGVAYGLAKYGVVEALDAGGAVAERYTVAPDGRVCIPVREHGNYVIYRLRIVRGRAEKPPMQVHFKTGPARGILGLIREER
jgi:hypothetical protein